jgi:hypothetical protein
MSSISASTLALRSVGLPPSLAAGAPSAADLAAGRQAAAWFNQPVVEGSQVLRAPVQPASGDGQALCQRFLACLQGPDAA